jgi:CRISPR-associated protein Csx17
MNELTLDGCTPEPLMGYLKALGVLRLVSEQADPDARGCWRDGTFVLETRLDRIGLVEFFRDKYKPTPIVVPWSGGDFFGVRVEPHVDQVSKAPTASEIIEAFLATDSPRLAGYRCVIQEALATMKAIGITQKSDIEGASKKKAKARFLACLRSALPDDFLGWLDAAAQLADDSFSFNALLGSGGGSDGNTHFSDNFMQNLWDCLPDFDGQRVRLAALPDLDSVLFGTASRSLRQKRTASLFDSGAVGGPNASIGFERDSLLNPWSFVFALEGCICLAGAVVKRQQATRRSSAFPFAVRMTATGFGSGVDKEQGQNEIWMPLWHRALSFPELEYLFETGRSEVGRRPARTGLDFARAVAGVGVDAGIDAFARYAIVRGRVGGDNYNTAVMAGVFAVRHHPLVGLLEGLDEWLDSFRLACRTKDQGAKADPPPRFPSAMRRIEAAIFEFCKYGGAHRLSAILAALGHAERELAVGGKRPEDRRTWRPLGGLAPGWLVSADDDSAEFRLARGVAFLNHGTKGTGHVRRNLEPVDYNSKLRSWTWSDRGGHVVWSHARLSRNLGAVLIRRLLDSERNGEPIPPFGSSFPVRFDDIARYLRNDVNEEKLEDLIWGLSLVECDGQRGAADPGDTPLPSVYALLKLTLLPGRLEWCRSGASEPVLRINTPRLGDVPGGVAVRPEPAILARLRAADVQGACDIAARRLRAAGVTPMASLLADGTRRAIDWSAGEIQPDRLLAALLFPLPDNSVNQLADIVLHRPRIDSLI